MIKDYFLASCLVIGFFTSCTGEYNTVYKWAAPAYKYEYAKECFANGQYNKAINLLTDQVQLQKGTANAQESLYMLAMAEFLSADYESASATFRKYVEAYPKGDYAEMAKFYVGESLYMSTPEPRLDQSGTVAAIQAFQAFLDLYPNSPDKVRAQQRLFALQDKLVQKELHTAQLYYDLGTYFDNCSYGGNNYEACVVTAQNALKDYPYTSLREAFSVLIMKSKYELARQSVESKKLERYQDAEDECYGFINQYPDSPDRSLAERYAKRCKEIIAGLPQPSL